MTDLKAIFDSLETTEAVISEEGESNMAEAADVLFERSTLVTSKARELARAIIDSQKELRTDAARVSSGVESVIDSMTTLSRDMRSIEMEAVALPNLDAWITNVTSELAHMKAQAIFLHEIFQEEKAGKRPSSTTLRSSSGKDELKKIVRKKSSKL